MTTPVRRCAAPLFAALAAAAVVAGCAGAPTTEAGRRPDAQLVEMLLDPAPLVEAAVGEDAGSLHRRLLAEGLSPSLDAEIRTLAASAPADPGLRLLEAQAAAVAGEADRALDNLRRTFGAAGDGPAEAEALRGWALERRHAWVEALAAYRSAGEALPSAAERARTLEPMAIDAATSAFSEALDRRRLPEARQALEALQTVRPDGPEATESALRLARALGDPQAELEALRALAPSSGERRRRWAMLEVEEGDAALGVRLIERAAAESPGDPEVAAELERAKFLFRLANAPEELRGLARSPELDRAGLARLLYWLVPEVRATRAASARIATDVLEHPDRDEIVRVVNLDLIGLDPSLRTFSPDRPATRGDLFGALEALRWIGRTTSQGREAPCAAAVRHGWVGDPAACRPDGRVSGAEAVEWIRRGTSRAATPGNVR